MSCGCGTLTLPSIPEDISAKIHNHPCYSEGAHHHYARIHLPVAPACNIQCNYCNRKFDCSNESRPGVTSMRLKPEEGIKKVLYVGGKLHRLSVVGIAGPGDSLADAKKTLPTLALIKEHAPDLKLCISTNGLLLEEYLDDLITLGVDHVTVTINTIDPEIGAKIYPWVFYQGKRYKGVEAASLLLQKQLLGIEKAVQKGLLIKANSVLIPGINDHHLPLVSQKLRELGVFLHNIMPLLSEPEFGTYFALNGVRSATDEELSRVQEACGMDIRLMTHCRQCRADAVGLVGEDQSGEIHPEEYLPLSIEALKEHYNVALRNESFEKIELFRKALDKANERIEKESLSSNGQTFLVAVTSGGEGMINQHFGSVKEFLIYEAGDKGVKFRQARKISTEYCTGPDSCGNPMDEICSRLHDCTLILTAKIGSCPQESLAKVGLITSEKWANQPIEKSILEAVQEYIISHDQERG